MKNFLKPIFGANGGLETAKILHVPRAANVLADALESLRRGPAPMLDVPVGESEVAALIMPVGGRSAHLSDIPSDKTGQRRTKRRDKTKTGQSSLLTLSQKTKTCQSPQHRMTTMDYIRKIPMQALHHDPVQVAAQEANKFFRP